MGAITIGNAATDRTSSSNGARTLRDYNSAATATGFLTVVNIWAATEMTECKVGVCKEEGMDTTWKAYASLGTITAGSAQTFTGLAIAVTAQDNIALYFNAGSIECSTTGSGYRYASGDRFGTVCATTNSSSKTLSVGATGFSFSANTKTGTVLTGGVAGAGGSGGYARASAALTGAGAVGARMTGTARAGGVISAAVTGGSRIITWARSALAVAGAFVTGQGLVPTFIISAVVKAGAAAGGAVRSVFSRGGGVSGGGLASAFRTLGAARAAAVLTGGASNAARTGGLKRSGGGNTGACSLGFTSAGHSRSGTVVGGVRGAGVAVILKKLALGIFSRGRSLTVKSPARDMTVKSRVK